MRRKSTPTFWCSERFLLIISKTFRKASGCLPLQGTNHILDGARVIPSLIKEREEKLFLALSACAEIYDMSDRNYPNRDREQISQTMNVAGECCAFITLCDVSRVYHQRIN